MAAPWEKEFKTFAQHHILLMFAFSLLVSLGIVVYFHTDLRAFKEESQQRLAQAEAEFQAKIHLLENETRSNQEALEHRLASKNQVLEQTIRGMREEYQAKIQSLLSSVEDIEQKSHVQLDDLKKELQDVSKASGDLSDIIDQALNSIVSVTTDAALGSGAIISQNGHIVTNNHVVEGARSISITLRSGKVYEAQLVYRTAEYDLAILKIQGYNLPFLEFANSDLLRPGDKVVALGNPAGLQFSATQGIVSAVHRTIGYFRDVIQIDVPINTGSSGGPLINRYGRIIGITSFKIKGQESLGFAIPSNSVKRVYEEVVV